MKQEEFNLLIFELLKQIIQNQSDIIGLLKLNKKNKNIRYCK
jgi:hypothetical protein